MRIAIVGSGIAGLGCAHALRDRAALTLFEAAPRLGGHTNTVDVSVDGRTLRRRHRLPRLQRAHLSAADPPVRRTRRADRGERHVLRPERGAGLGPPPRMGRREPFDGVRAAAQSRLAGVPAHARATCCASTRRPRASSPAAPMPLQQSLGAFLEANRYGAELRDWYLLPMAGRHLVVPARDDARLSGGDVPALLPQPRPAAGHRPAAVVHGARRRAPVRRRDRAAPARRAPRQSGARGATRSAAAGVRGDHDARHRALRSRGARLPQRPVAAPARRCRRRRSAERSAPAATSRTAPCCTPTRGCCRARAACGPRGTI